MGYWLSGVIGAFGMPKEMSMELNPSTIGQAISQMPSAISPLSPKLEKTTSLVTRGHLRAKLTTGSASMTSGPQDQTMMDGIDG